VGRRRTGRPRNRQEARARARSRTTTRQQREPTWRGAVNRGAIAAGVFMLLLVFLFNRPFAEAAYLSAFMLLVYIPMGYYLDRFFYRVRMNRERKYRERKRAEEG
jgi:hypothetical protein